MLQIHTHGTPLDRGRQQGEQCLELATPFFLRTLEVLAERIGADGPDEAVDQTRAKVARWRAQTRAVYPEGDEECRGLAEGLQVEEDRYFAALYTHVSQWTGPQCTTCGIYDEAGRPLVAKTDDIGLRDRGMNVMEITRPDRGHRHVHFHFAGTIWTIAGMNERGLAMGMTGIPGPAVDTEGLPTLSALHTVLPNCATVQEAIAHLERTPVNSYGFSLHLADAAGGLSLIERTALGVKVLPRGAGGLALHTNHILDPEFAAQNPPQREPYHTNGSNRLRTAEKVMHDAPRTEESLAALLSSRDPTGPICQQGTDDMHTDFGVLFRPADMRMTLWAGYPGVVEPEDLDVRAMLA